MKRRDFLTAAGVSAAAAATGVSAFAQEQQREPRRRSDRPAQRYIEVQKMLVDSPEKVKALTDFARETLMPVLKKLNVGPFGMAVAEPGMNGKDADTPQRELFFFLPYTLLFQAMIVRDVLAANPAVGEAYMAYKAGFSSKNPGYVSLESTLLKNFKMMPKVEVPSLAEDRILQLRYYRSFDPERNRMKIRMFEEGGELALFRHYGMPPVFFGDAMFGAFLPNMTYMLSFENQEKKDAAWKAFAGSPEWKKLSSDPLYADTATDIINYNLRPCKGSEI